MDASQNDRTIKDISVNSKDNVALKTLPLAAAMPAPEAKKDAPAVGASLLADIAAALDGVGGSVATVATSMPAATDAAPVAPNKAKIIVKALRSIEQNISNIIRLLEEDAPADSVAAFASDMTGAAMEREAELASVRPVDGRVVEGVFDGQHMVGSDGKIYTVPPNYASKSKLVEGDLLKLTITPKGSFIYKQIGPIERSRIVGSLGFDHTIGEYYVTGEDKRWSVIKASVTYFKGEAGDEAVILVPKANPSKWAAVENIIKKNPLV